MAATLKCDTIQNASSATANITLDTNGNATVGNNASVTGTLAMGSSFLRNRLINGGMNVYQRGSVSATTSGAYTLDRWFVTPTGATVTVTQNGSIVPTNFAASLNIAAAASVTNVSAYQRIESINCQDFASGAVVTVSGWIRQSTGSAVTTATVALTTPTASDNYTSTSSAATTYTIPSIASSTWVYFSNAFTLTTSCTNGLQVTIALGTGLTTGSLNLTGLQCEVGSVATPFERRLYAQELFLAQRYYYRLPNGTRNMVAGFSRSTTVFRATIYFAVPMRANITAVEQNGTAADYEVVQGSSDIACSSVVTFQTGTNLMCTVNATVASGLTAGYAGYLGAAAANTAYLAWSAEL